MTEDTLFEVPQSLSPEKQWLEHLRRRYHVSFTQDPETGQWNAYFSRPYSGDGRTEAEAAEEMIQSIAKTKYPPTFDQWRVSQP